MRRRHRTLTTMMMVIAAFAIAAMHVGTADRPMTMTPMDASASGEAARMPSMAQSVDQVQPASSAMSGGATSSVQGRHGLAVMTMTMLCELLVLVAAAGYLLCRLVARRSTRSADLAPSTPVLEHPHRGLRPARPPGLSMLCVAIC